MHTYGGRDLQAMKYGVAALSSYAEGRRELICRRTRKSLHTVGILLEVYGVD
jgi:hypothetical protein